MKIFARAGRECRKVCRRCLREYKRSNIGIAARQVRKTDPQAKWGKGRWPEWVYLSDGEHRLCTKHLIESRTATARRRAVMLNASPVWADLDAIRSIYDAARAKGAKYVVDHVIPLQGKTVCGLHVADNLQIITNTENGRKSNKFG